MSKLFLFLILIVCSCSSSEGQKSTIKKKKPKQVTKSAKKNPIKFDSPKVEYTIHHITALSKGLGSNTLYTGQPKKSFVQIAYHHFYDGIQLIHLKYYDVNSNYIPPEEQPITSAEPSPLSTREYYEYYAFVLRNEAGEIQGLYGDRGRYFDENWLLPVEEIQDKTLAHTQQFVDPLSSLAMAKSEYTLVLNPDQPKYYYSRDSKNGQGVKIDTFGKVSPHFRIDYPIYHGQYYSHFYVLFVYSTWDKAG